MTAPKAEKLPENLAWIVNQLERYEVRLVHSFTPDAGPPKTRAASSPFDCFGGTVTMDGKSYKELLEFANQNRSRPFLIEAPKLGTEIAVVFISGEGEQITPYAKQQTISIHSDADSTHTVAVRIVLSVVWEPSTSKTE